MTGLQLRSPMNHHVKCWPEFFRPLWDGDKLAEWRLNDRDYRAGDTLHQQEWDPHTETYSGREVSHLITHAVDGQAAGIPEGYAMMSLRPLQEFPANVVAILREMDGLLELQDQRLREAGDQLLRYGNSMGPACKMYARDGEGFRKQWLRRLADAEPGENAPHAAAITGMDTAVTVTLARLDKVGHPHREACDLAGAWGMLKALLQQQTVTRPHASSALPTPADLHRTIGQARGLIQTAIGQMRDLGIVHVTKHLCSARRHLDGGKAHIESALLAVIPEPQDGGPPNGV